ncbi:hypothetical protein [Spirosoma endophyticum]|uniref:Envelope transporter n=1 Tax=Spirosoma endophyticum TaxID=662367 RepID=A0A1I2FBZ7_9BACT|nr:hypothetical protein [Spirosoma endophyticum]SFF03004.1 envelope transporter [Spirosoma endophyticum]
MIVPVFEVSSLLPRSFMQRLLNQHPLENAIIELNNLLASMPVRSISAADINSIERKYNLTLLDTFTLNLEEFYTVYLNYALQDRRLSEEASADLSHLQILLQLPPQTIKLLQERIGEVIYRQSIEEVINDGVVTSEEHQFLQRLQQTLSLPSDLANKISEDVYGQYLSRLIEKLSADARITPEDERQIEQISKNLGVKPDQSTKQSLARYKLYWTLENTDLPVIDISFPLQKLESCHFYSDDMQWFEERATARRTNVDDHYINHKTLDEIDLQVNSTTRQTRFDLLKRIDVGQIYLTNKRILIVGRLKTTSIKLNTINKVIAYRQGIEVGKLTGKSPLLLLKRDADVAAIICRRLLTQA